MTICRDWARGLPEALPNGAVRILKATGTWLPPEDLAPMLTEFFVGR
jgi:hypothetical protein